MTLSFFLQLLFIAGFIYGIRLMNSPETAVRGNQIGALAMAGAIVVIMVQSQVLTMPVIWAGLIVGSALGVWLSVKVLMIQMPQMVALLNGFGGGASALVALVTIYLSVGAASAMELIPFTWFTSGLAVLVGGVTLSGSLVAAGKLHGKLNQRPVHLPQHNLQLFASLGVMVLSILALTFSIGHPLLHAVILTVGSLYWGYVFTIRVGGADMPITISLLNSFSGVAGAIAGFALENGALLVVVGSIVGASGLILTQIMCKAMNTSLMKILTGKTTATKKSTPVAKPKQAPVPVKEAAPSKPQGPVWEEAVRLAKKVVIIPGYGMALAQAQLQVKQLADLMASQGKEVRFGIHPVAGRMPGHMNVLLAEVDVPYDQLYELDAINAFLEDADLSIIIGANDVVNPAAIELEDTPIYGMPIIRADHAKQVFVCNFDTKPGYAGVDNSLYEMDKVELLLGDAKDGIAKITAVLKGEKAQETSAEAATPEDDLVGKLSSAKKVVIIPGYGMALAQAQGQVKQLGELLESQGKEVRYGIHPVAGRMPGHMNVLLAEVDVPYDKLYELDAINAFLEETDVAIIVGANDVVNPAAIELEDTPIYGMPIIRADSASHVLICNYDTKPGYAGVDNSLYAMDKVQLLLGDAKDSLAKLIAAAKGEGAKTGAPAQAQADDPVAKLLAAKRVVVVPGYGMALAQAQGQVKRLVDLLQSRGVRVEIAVHPVAGRMPGHMNVLMAEVDIPYELMLEMDQINDQFKDVDVAVVVGANDVINPAANTHADTPIYGMPILNVEHARHVIIYNLDRAPGYAGVENTLYDAPNCTFVPGDAGASLQALVDSLRAAG